ncbi:lymphocyte function-associated antigen 3 [Danio aesculapii]|uniref:lymphocyte function-associated antigen 3 n=1 Tax=Danio aesculapii TaxID=1142201 RepID=UPI0024C007BB|nr:lymphocyte function-associated antigen 3 [Danio aesculapii]
MEFVVRVWLFFTCLCFPDFVFCEEYAEMGGLITLSPSIRGKPVEILWKHNGDKVVEYDNSEMEEYGSFKDRVELDFETGQLTIKKLASQDGGQYQSDITINGKVQSSRHTLTVLDVLPDPRVTCEVNEASNLQELLCSVDYKTPLLYKWSGPNVIDHPGAELIIDEQQKNSDSIYTCTVKNEVSSKTTDFNLQDCVTGAAAAARLQVILPVLFVILLFIFLIILAVFIYRRRKSRSEQKKRDPENALSEATLPSQMRLKYQNDSDKKQDEGNGSDNTGENEEKTALLNHNGNEEELYRSENSLHAVIEEENAYSKPDETQKLQEDRDEEEEEGQRDELEKGNDIGKTSLEHLNKTPEEFKIDDGDDDENNVKIPGEKKEEVNGEEKDQQNTDSEKPPIENNSDAFSSLKDRRADTDIDDENKTVKSDDNKEDIETKAEQNDDDDDDAEGSAK